MRSPASGFRFCTLALALALAACGERAPDNGGEQPPAAVVEAPSGAEDFTPDAIAVADNNRGAAIMGRFEYDAATALFETVVARWPSWLDARMNLAIAVLNRQVEGDEQRALDLAESVLAVAPDDLRAQYVAGLLKLYRSQTDAAIGHFRRVVEADPADAYAAYFLAQALTQAGDTEGAVEWYARARAIDPYLRSAYYGAMQALQRTGRSDEARVMMEQYRRLDRNPRARLAEYKYTRMGPKAEIAVIGETDGVQPPRPQGQSFGPPAELAAGVDAPASAGLRLSPTPGPDAGLTVVDLQGDGALDLFVTGLGDAGTGRLLITDGGQGMHPAEAFAPGAVPGVRAALWGDIDNDGDVDLYLCRRGPNQLWRQDADGTWSDVTAAAGVDGGDRDSTSGRLIDADHDGDLDLFVVNADGPNALLSNNADGSFRDIAGEAGVAGDARASRGIVVADLDADLDLDLIVLNETPPNEVYLNDRLWRYRPPEGFAALVDTPLTAAVAGDLDADGRPEILGLGTDGALLRFADSGAGWRASTIGRIAPEAAADATLGLVDPDGGGVRQLLVATTTGWSLIDPSGTGGPVSETPRHPLDDLVGIAPLLSDPVAGVGLVALDGSGRLVHWPPGPGRYPSLALTLSGRQNRAETLRSNASGIGSRVAARTGSQWTIVDALPAFSSRGQDLAPLAFGLAGAAAADFVVIDWPDGVMQTEVSLAAGRRYRVEEVQRQLSSCPVLFAWDGSGYRFVTDFLGVGGIGYAIGRGEYAESRPWERLLLPAGALQPRDGRLILKLTEPMEEAAYIDSAALIAWDLPPGWDLVLDERMGISPPAPTGRALFYRRELLARRVVNDRDQDVTDRVSDRDLVAAPVGALDRRFIGRLAGEHVLTLEFPQPLDVGSGDPVVVIDGWVEYPYSQTMFAAWQAGADYAAPTLEARDRDGAWHAIFPQFGYPAGMPRRMALPLGKLPPGTDALRLRTNMAVYWDRIAVAFAEPLPQAARVRPALVTARVLKTGFPAWARGRQQLPSYDYDRRAPFWDTRYQEGWYTSYGPAEPLVADTDDALAIIGPGDEIELAYDAPDGPPPHWTRRYLLDLHGWAKDADLFTRDGVTLAPLPDAGHPAGPRDTLHARFNLRFQGGE